MIVVEGPDGSGKTTLAHAIAAEFDMEYRRPPEEVLSSTEGPAGIALPEWWRKQMIRPQSERDNGVYDRTFYISEPIYQFAQVQRSLIVEGPDLFKGIADLWAEGPLLIFCLPTPDIHISNTIRDGRQSLKGLENKHLEKVDFLYWAFFALWLQAHNEVIQYDYTMDSQGYVFDAVRAFRGQTHA